MVIVLKKNSTEEQKKYICQFLKEKNFKLNEIVGEEDTVIAAVGKVSMDIREVELLPGVNNVIPISKPFKLQAGNLKKKTQ